MLFNNLTTERRASLIVKNSSFYIEIAKFVQAYTTIVKNPNEFLAEVSEASIDPKKQHLDWNQLKKIMQTCDFGFDIKPSDMDLVIYYNYALAMGSVTALDKRIASVDEVAEAQKHYYNFVDEEKAYAEEEYIKQKKIYEARQREMSYVDGKIAAGRAKNVFFMIMMFLSVVIGMVGIVSFFADNIIASTIGKVIPIWKEQYIGAIIMIVIMFVLFALFNSFYQKSKYEFEKLREASATLFDKEEELVTKQHNLKKKLDAASKDYNIVIKEINDKNQRYDVKTNIDKLITTNKYYQQFCETEELNKFAESVAVDSKTMASDDDFAPIKLSKEQEENMRSAKKEVIGLEGQIDMDAYKEKFEKSTKKQSKDEKESEETQEKQQETDELQQKLDEQKREQERKSFNESLDYAKNLLGVNNKSSENNEKEK